jgi:O-antigen/teichoic acid export membrane protein
MAGSVADGAAQKRQMRIRPNLRPKLAITAADQAVSSVTNFATTLVAARLLGVAGLGEVSLALAVAFVVLSVTRAGVGEPTLVFGVTDRGRGPLGVALAIGIAGAVLAIAASVTFAEYARVTAALAVVLPALAVQDAARYCFFANGRPERALFSDSWWALGQGAVVALAYATHPSPSLLVLAWGAGAMAGAIYGCIALRARPALREGIVWLRRSRHLSGWLAVQVGISQLSTQLILFVLVAIIGRDGLGALRAGQAVFAPLALAMGLLAVVALPRMRLERGKDAIARGVRMTAAAATTAAVGYGLVVVGGGDALLGAVFGGEFRRYSGLLMPLMIAAVAQAFAAAPGLGARSLVAGRAVAVTQAAAVVAGVPTIAVLARIDGLNGAAWGFAAQAAVLCAASWLTYGVAFRRNA